MSDQSQSSRFRALYQSAFHDYQTQTGTSLATHPLAEKLQNCDSVESITAVLQDQARAFSEFQGDNGRISKSLKGIVTVLYTLSTSTATIGLPFLPVNAIFTGFAVLLSVVKDVSASYDALVDLLESIEHFISRLDIYTRVPSTGAMTEIIVKIMVEIISTLALVTKQIKQKRPIKMVKKLLGENEIEAVLQRLDRLTLDEARTTAAQTLQVVYGLVQNMRAVIDDGKTSVDGVRDALEMIQQLASDLNKSKRDKLQGDIRNWLSPPDPWKNHNIACGSRHTGTAKWFIHGDTFSEWKSSGSSSLLWVHGKPGAGKSVLCSSIIENIDVMRKLGLASMAFFYCDFREEQKKDTRGLLSSWMVQLCHQSDAYSDILSNFYLEHNNGSRQPSDDSLVECLKEILKMPGQAPVYLIVDALDECPIGMTSSLSSPRDKALVAVENLIGSQFPNICICVTSRPETDIKAVLGPLTFRSISLHDESGQMEDIRNYIKSVVNTDRLMRRWKATDKQLVIDVLTNKADGMFRWVDCQLGYLRGCLPGRIRHALEELPETLDGTYERALNDLNKANWEVAHRLFQFVAVTSRPLRVEELAQFLGFDFTDSIPKFRQDWLLEDPVDAVLSTTSSLLAIVNVDDSQVIQFSHFSVKEFLTSSRLAETSDLAVRRYHIDMTRAHTLAAQSCLGMLLHLDQRMTEADLEKIHLAEYAAEHWVDHARIEDVLQEVEDATKQLFDKNKPHFSIWVWIHDLEDRYWHRGKRGKQPAEPRGMPLHYAALCGLDRVVNFLVVEHAQNVDSRGFEHRLTPLHLACTRGHVDVARALLDNGADAEAVDKRGSTPLHLASTGGHAKVVRVLLERGVDATIEDEQDASPPALAIQGGHVEVTNVFLEFGVGEVAEDVKKWPPLHRALFEGNIEVARTLLERGADFTEAFDDCLTPPRAALIGGHIEAVRVLLERGVGITVEVGGVDIALHLASETGNVEIVRILLEHGLDATAHDPGGETSLHMASVGGHVEIARLLLEYGTDATAQNDDEETPLHIVSTRGHVELAQILLEHGANATAPTKDGRTPLHYAAQSGAVEVARLLLEHGACATAEEEDGRTPLHFAAESGYVEVARLLLERGAGVTAQDDNERSPLQMALDVALEGGHVAVARLLLEHGADATAPTNHRRSPLHFAAQSGHVELALLLLEHGADTTAKDDDGATPLHLASELGHAEFTHVLLKHGSDTAARREDGSTPLYLAAWNGHIEVARLLLEHGADVILQEKDGCTPLHIASEVGHVDVVRLLLEHGADATARDNRRWTPLHFAAGCDHVDVACLLLGHGADAMAQNDDGATSLHLASQPGYTEFTHVLLKHGADPTTQKKDGSTPLHLVAWDGHIEVARLLLEHGAGVIVQEKDGCTPLHMASLGGQVEVVRLLLEHGANATASARDGRTPLHFAAESGFVEVICLLLEHGAYATAKAKDLWTPLHSAALNGDVEVVCLLLEHGANPTAHANNGSTPFDLASQRGYEDVTRILEHTLDGETHGRDPRSTLRVPEAEEHVKYECLPAQLEADATALAEDGQTSIQVVEGEGDIEPACDFLGHEADTTTEAEDGQTLSDVAGAKIYVELARQLSKYGLDAIC